MKQFVIWGMFGDILDKFDTEEEADEFMEEGGYDEITRTHNGEDVNIMVCDY